MAVSPDTAYAWRRVDLCLVLVLNSLSTYALSYFTLPWLATLAITAVACYCAVTGVCSILLLKKVNLLSPSLPSFPPLLMDRYLHHAAL